MMADDTAATAPADPETPVEAPPETGEAQEARIAKRKKLLRILAIVVVTIARSEEHTSELQSLMRISYAVFCLNKKKQLNDPDTHKRKRKRMNSSQYYEHSIHATS